MTITGSRGRLRADLVEQLEPVSSRHADVGHQHVGLFAAQRGQYGIGLLEGCRAHAALLERALEHPADRGVVVDDPDVKCFRLDSW